MTQPPLIVRHAVAAFLVATGNAVVMGVIPLIAVLHFQAADWQSALVTIAIPAAMFGSVFWNRLLTAIGLRRFLLLYWAVAWIPLGLIALAQNYWHLLALHAVAAAGATGSHLISGALLKRLYGDASRGRAYGVLTATTTCGTIVTLFAAGRALAADAEAFRWILPGVVLLEGVGVAILFQLASSSTEHAPVPLGAFRWREALAPIARMGRALREDPLFARYEAAFMTYGAGFMICEVLLPLLVRSLGLDYDQATESAYVVRSFCMLLLAVPMGLALDRIGPARTSAVSFGVLALYPAGLALAGGQSGIAVASAFFGIGLAGVLHGWMLGPVALAPTSERVSEYVAIHSSLVGLRGVLFQGLGIVLFRLTAGFTLPFVVAAIAFLWAAWQMWSLQPRLRARVGGGGASGGTGEDRAEAPAEPTARRSGGGRVAAAAIERGRGRS